MAEILYPLFLPFVRQKYLSTRQKTNTELRHHGENENAQTSKR